MIVVLNPAKLPDKTLYAAIYIFYHTYLRSDQNPSTLQTTVGDTVPVNSDFS